MTKKNCKRKITTVERAHPINISEIQLRGSRDYKIKKSRRGQRRFKKMMRWVYGE